MRTLEELYRAYRDDVYRYLYSLTHDAAQAEVLYRWMTTSVRDAAAILEKRFPEK